LFRPWQTDEDRTQSVIDEDLFEWRAALFRFWPRAASMAKRKRIAFSGAHIRLRDDVCFALLEPFIDRYIRIAILDAPVLHPQH